MKKIFFIFIFPTIYLLLMINFYVKDFTQINKYIEEPKQKILYTITESDNAYYIINEFRDDEIKVTKVSEVDGKILVDLLTDKYYISKTNFIKHVNNIGNIVDEHIVYLIANRKDPECIMYIYESGVLYSF